MSVLVSRMPGSTICGDQRFVILSVLEEGVGKLAKLHSTPGKDGERRVLPMRN